MPGIHKIDHNPLYTGHLGAEGDSSASCWYTSPSNHGTNGIAGGKMHKGRRPKERGGYGSPLRGCSYKVNVASTAAPGISHRPLML
eukprot:1161414-Pelagomonas_calceolata.AAC.2